MAASNPTSVWANYVPPRGQCNFKQSLVSPKCGCLRFMLHPLKSTSSFECDGCAHHASFHSMENKEEDEIRKRWEQEARDKRLREYQSTAAERPSKRLRELEYGRGDAGGAQTLMIEGELETPGETTGCETGGRRRAGAKKKAAAAPSRTSRSKGRITEVTDKEECIELD